MPMVRLFGRFFCVSEALCVTYRLEDDTDEGAAVSDGCALHVARGCSSRCARGTAGWRA